MQCPADMRAQKDLIMPTPFLSKSVFCDDSALSRAFRDLSTYPHAEPQALSRNGRAIGNAGEHVVDSLAARHGLVLAVVDDGLSFDRVLQLPGTMIRLQIKTRTKPLANGYLFAMSKGYRGAPAGVRPYAPNDFDLAALVVLPLNFVFFSAAKTPRIMVTFEQIRRLRTDPLASLDSAVQTILQPDAVQTPRVSGP